MTCKRDTMAENISCETNEFMHRLHPVDVDLWMENEGVRSERKLDC
jgi:hypothetical protein